MGMTTKQLEAGAAKARQVASAMSTKAKALDGHVMFADQMVGLSLMSDLFSGAALVMEAMAKGDEPKATPSEGAAA